jgi:outer membrane protein, multidrug efflux system
MQNFRKQYMNKKSLSVLIAALLVGGCAVTPESFKSEEIQQRIETDRVAMFKDQEPLSKPLTLWEALARGLKYNLDHRVKLMENVLAERILQTHSYEMLPDLVADAGYRHRNNYSGGISQSLLDGRVSLEPSTSEELRYADGGLTFTWNLLDLGVSHAIAHQKANDVLITRERRRRVIQNIMVDIYQSYWRAVGAARLLPQVEKLLDETRVVLSQSKEMESQGLQNPETALLYRKQLLESLRDLSKLREELNLAKSQLAALINIPMQQAYELAIPDTYRLAPELDISLEELEIAAMSSQPELLEEDYNVRNKVWEVKKAVRRMYPGLEVSLGQRYNSNDFLFNSSWFHAGVSISWNLLNLFTTGPAAKQEAEAHVKLGEHRRMALSMAVMTQVWVSHMRYTMARQDFKLAEEIYQVNSGLSDLTDKALQAKAKNEMDLVLRRTQTLSSQLNLEMAYADMHTALARVFHSVGADPLPRSLIDAAPYSFSEYSVEDLALVIEKANHGRLSGKEKMISE